MKQIRFVFSVFLAVVISQVPMPAEAGDVIDPRPHVNIEISKDGQVWQPEMNEVGDVSVYLRYVVTASPPGLEIYDVEWLDFMGQEVISPVELHIYPRQPMRLQLDTNWGQFEYESALITIYPHIYITEVFPNPEGSDTGQEWVELYNPQPFPVDLEKVFLSINSKPIHTFGADDKLGVGEYRQVMLPKSPLPNCTTTCDVSVQIGYFSLVVDEMNYQSTKSGRSWSQRAEGGWTLEYPLSPGAENLPPRPPASVVLPQAPIAAGNGQAVRGQSTTRLAPPEYRLPTSRTVTSPPTPMKVFKLHLVPVWLVTGAIACWLCVPKHWLQRYWQWWSR